MNSHMGFFKHSENITNASIVFNKPKIFFDYFTEDFKINFNLLKVNFLAEPLEHALMHEEGKYIPTSAWAKK